MKMLLIEVEDRTSMTVGPTQVQYRMDYPDNAQGAKMAAEWALEVLAYLASSTPTGFLVRIL